MNKNKLLFKQRFSPNNKVIANHLMNNIKMIKEKRTIRAYGTLPLLAEMIQNVV